MAAAQAITDAYIRARFKDRRGLETEDLRALHRALMEDVLYGYDVLPTACHLTAATLAMLAPEIAFKDMHLWVMPLGVFRGRVDLGSLDFLEDPVKATQFSLFETATEPTRTSASRNVQGKAYIPEAGFDVCVMNPPFVRSVGGNLLFGSLPDERGTMQTELKRRAKALHASITPGLGPIFVALADKYLKAGGRLAFVLPLGLTSGEAWADTRELIASRYDLEMVVSSHDPERFHFSENTNLSEILFIARKRAAPENPAPKTTYVSLWQNPGSIHASLDIAQRITATPEGLVVSSAGTVGEVFQLSRSDGVANWHGALFARGQLARAYLELRSGRLRLPGHHSASIVTIPLSDLGDLGPDRRRIHEAFDLSFDAPSAHPAFWDHKSEKVTTIVQRPNAWLHPRTTPRYADKKGSPDYAQYPLHLWKAAGDILLVERLRTNTHRLLAVRVSRPALGNTWWPLKATLSAKQKKALLIWLNSTPGLLLFYGSRVVTCGPWVQMKKPAWAAMPVLDVRRLKTGTLDRLAEAYDAYCRRGLLALSKLAQDSARKDIDDALSGALQIADLAVLREWLGQEPGLTGVPLGRPAMQIPLLRKQRAPDIAETPTEMFRDAGDPDPLER